MKYISEHNLCFVHIPKNGGRSVRKALAEVGDSGWEEIAIDLGISPDEAEKETETGAGFLHPQLGRIHPSHLPLAYLESHFPEFWAVFCNARTFGLTREPRARFISALMQHLKEFKDVGNVRADDRIVIEGAAQVCDWLSQRDTFCDIEYCHFTRQVDFIFLQGQRFTEHVFPLDRLDVLQAWLISEADISIDIEHGFLRRQPKKWAKPIQPIARSLARTLMPPAVRSLLHPLWMKSPFFDNAAKGYKSIQFPDEVESFIDVYYRQDALLHQEACGRADQLSAAASR